MIGAFWSPHLGWLLAKVVLAGIIGGHSGLRSGQQIQLDPRLLRLAGGIPATGAAMTAPVDYGQRFFEGSREPSALGGGTAFAFHALLNADVSARDQWTSNP